MEKIWECKDKEYNKITSEIYSFDKYNELVNELPEM